MPANDSSRIPRTFICLDSEAIIEKSNGVETHRFRCAVTSIDKMSRKDDTWRTVEYRNHDTPEELWQYVTSKAKSRERTVVVAHNAGYDLRITKAFSLLPALGFSLIMFSLAPGASWVTWRSGQTTIQIIDSLSWLPTSLENIGRALNLDKPQLPLQTDSGEDWYARCSGDINILRTAWLQIVNWLRENDCGNWKPTGAGMGFAAFRHRHLTHRLLIHDDEQQRERERRAAWTGRAEPWRFGVMSDGPWLEYDYECAYAQIAAECSIPTKYVGKVVNPTLDIILGDNASRAYLCDVMVTTQVPTLPCEREGKIIWPIGTFRTIVWSHELKLAESFGAQIRLLNVWSYRAAPALAQWAAWVLELTHSRSADVPPTVRILAKHWCRSVIGRFGSRFPTWDEIGESRTDDPRLSGYADFDTGSVGQLMEVGKKAFLALGLTDHPESIPQIMSWIMAECRVRLFHAAYVAGPDNVVYMDTDSIIVNADGAENLERHDLPGLRKKSRYQSLEILGTRRLVQNGQLKAAGIPKGAVQIGSKKWSGQAWSSMATDLADGNADSVRVVERTVRIHDEDSRRIMGPNGESLPILVGTA